MKNAPNVDLEITGFNKEINNFYQYFQPDNPNSYKESIAKLFSDKGEKWLYDEYELKDLEVHSVQLTKGNVPIITISCYAPGTQAYSLGNYISREYNLVTLTNHSKKPDKSIKAVESKDLIKPENGESKTQENKSSLKKIVKTSKPKDRGMEM